MMSKRMRIVIAFVLIEGLLAGLWWWLAQYARANPDRVTADQPVVLGETIGGAMGLVAGLSLVLFFVAWKNDRRAK